MIVKLLLLPFRLVTRAGGIVVTSLTMGMALTTGICRFAFNRIIGGIVGALAGTLLGRKHVGVKVFPKKR